jgi:hypothetical protein
MVWPALPFLPRVALFPLFGPAAAKPKFDRNLSFSILSQKEISGQFFSYFFDFAVLLGEVTSKNCIKSYSSSTLCFLLIVFVF